MKAQKSRKASNSLGRVGRHLVLAFIVVVITVAAGYVVSLHSTAAPASDSNEALAEATPLLTSPPAVLQLSNWTTLTNTKDGFSLSVPKTWKVQSVPSGDPDDGYYIVLQDPADSRRHTFLAVSSSETGEGTPGPLVSQQAVTYHDVVMQKFIWQSSTQRLLQYRFSRNGTFFLLQTLAPRADDSVFMTTTQIASRFQFIP